MSKVSIERVVNGWEIEYRDPEIVKENNKPKSGTYRDPMKEMVFMTTKEVTDFLTKNLEKLCAAEDYETSFSKAVMESEDDD
jgi:hypothetical protein